MLSKTQHKLERAQFMCDTVENKYAVWGTHTDGGGGLVLVRVHKSTLLLLRGKK